MPDNERFMLYIYSTNEGGAWKELQLDLLWPPGRSCLYKGSEKGPCINALRYDHGGHSFSSSRVFFTTIRLRLSVPAMGGYGAYGVCVSLHSHIDLGDFLGRVFSVSKIPQSPLVICSFSRDTLFLPSHLPRG